VLPNHKDLELMIVQEELTQPHREDTDDTVTTEFVSNHKTHHRDVNGVLPKHKDLELMIVKKELQRPHQEDMSPSIKFVDIMDKYAVYSHSKQRARTLAP